MTSTSQNVGCFVGATTLILPAGLAGDSSRFNQWESDKRRKEILVFYLTISISSLLDRGLIPVFKLEFCLKGYILLTFQILIN